MTGWHLSCGLIISVLSSLVSIAQPKNLDEILYLDEEAGFILLAFGRGNYRQGDRVCISRVQPQHTSCAGQFQRVDRKPIVFLPTEELKNFEAQDEVIVERIYLKSQKKGGDFVDPNTYLGSIVFKKESNAKDKNILEKNKETKVPAGGKIPVAKNEITLSDKGFPEITVPKIRRPKRKPTRKEKTNVELVAKSIKKVLRKKNRIRYSFVPMEQEKEGKNAAESTAQENTEIKTIYPRALTHSLEWELMSSVPYIPLATFNSLRFRTIENSTLSRSTLWNKNKQELDPLVGGGINLHLVQNYIWTKSLGFRYHGFDRAKSRSTFDSVSRDFEAESTSKVEMWAVHADYGYRWYALPWLYLSGSAGLEIFSSTLKFKATNINIVNEQRDLIAFAESNFIDVGSRINLSINLSLRSFAIAIGNIFTVPLTNISQDFDGEVAVPERLTMTEDPKNDLKNNITHKRSSFASEVYIGISYKPQR